MPRLSDAEIIAAIEGEEAIALDGRSGELAKERSEALDRYQGRPLGNEVEGRSQVVDKSILDTIEWIMPSLIRIYMGGDEIGRFDPIGPEDEEAAQAETDVCNWYLEAKNDMFSHVNSTLRDALLLKNGYMVAFWQCKYDTMVETYVGQSDEEATMLSQDPEVTVTAHSEYMDPEWQQPPPQVLQQMAMQAQAQGQPFQPPQCPMLHDIKVERKKCEEFVQVESIPPDELLVSRNHRWTSLMDASFVQWRRRVTVGQLRSEGFDVPDDVPSYENFSQEWASRQRFQENQFVEDETPDPARRVVVFKDTYMRINLKDDNDKGIPQLWRFCGIDGDAKLIRKEEADIIPFAAFSPIIYPHSHVGSSVYDLINDVGLIKTTLQRQFLDNVYQQNSGEKAVDSSRVNMDDLLVTRPGGIKRVEGDPNGAIMPLTTPDVTGAVLNALSYMDDVKEQRTGISKNTVGLDANSLNKTATGVQMQQSAANSRLELIARTLAGGFKDLFLIVHALACKHSTKPLQAKLKGKWVAVNPREWTRRTDFTISVGLGTGNPEAQMQKLMAMMPVQQAAMGLGLAGPTEAYNFAKELWKAAGWKMSDKFVHPPQTDPRTGQPVPPPQQPPPEVQVEQMRQQGKQQELQQNAQLEQAKMQQNGQIEAQQLQLQDQIKQRELASQQQIQASNDARDWARTQAELQLKDQMHQRDVQMQAALEEKKLMMLDIQHQREMDNAIRIAYINAQAKTEAAEIQGAKGPKDGGVEAQEAAGAR